MTNADQGDRKSVATPPDIVTDPVEVAKKEASNALRQFDAVIEYIEQARSGQPPFKLRPSTLLSLNRFALEGINRFAGNYRPSDTYITQSKHKPPSASAVPGFVEELCEYVNENFGITSALHLAAYVM
jgi:Fic family protein